MEKSKELLGKTLTDLEAKEIKGGSRAYGLSQIWGGIMDAVTGGCSWPGGFYGKPSSGGGGTCTRR